MKRNLHLYLNIVNNSPQPLGARSNQIFFIMMYTYFMSAYCLFIIFISPFNIDPWTTINLLG